MPLMYKPVQNVVESASGNKEYSITLVKFNEVITTKKVAEKLALLSALSPGDVYNLLCNLGYVVGDLMLEGHTVNLENFGRFTIKAIARGNSVPTPEEVNPRMIKNLRVQFTPSGTREANGNITRSMLSGVRFERYGSQSEMFDYGQNNDGDGDDYEQDPNA